MLNAKFQLKRPRQFEICYEDITFDNEHVIVRPTHLSICNADQRYYQGNRPENNKISFCEIYKSRQH